MHKSKPVTVKNSWWKYYPKTKDYLLLWIILWSATFFRFNGLNEPGLWLDEVAYTIAAQRPIFDQITKSTQTLGNYLSVDPTLSAIPFSLSLKLGFSNFLARFPAAVFGILGVALIYRLGRTFFDHTTGLVAAFLLGISSFHILYSQEARSYTQFIFFGMASFLFLYQAIRHDKVRYWGIYTFWAWAGVSTNHLMIFALAAQGVFLSLVCLRSILLQPNQADIIKNFSKTLGYFLLAVLIIFLLRLPWWEDFTQRQCAGCDVGHPSYPLDITANGLRSLQAFTRTTPTIATILIAFQLIGLVLAIYHLPKRGVLLACWLLASIFVTIAGLWFISQFFHERYTIWGLPAFLLLAAYGLVNVVRFSNRFLIANRDQSILATLAKAATFTITGLLLISISLASFYQTQQNPVIKQTWPVGQLQEATSYIGSHAQTNEVVIGVPNAQYLQFYLQPIRQDLIYLDMKSASLPAKFTGAWYVFYDAKNIPPRWQNLDFRLFNDLLVLHRAGECRIQDCLNDVRTLFGEMAQANPETTLAEKIKMMLGGIATLPITQ